MRNVFPEYKSEIVLGNGKFQLDPMSYTVIYEGKEISLAPRSSGNSPRFWIFIRK